MLKKLEKAYQKCIKNSKSNIRVPVDKERFVDIAAMAQKRCFS